MLPIKGQKTPNSAQERPSIGGAQTKTARQKMINTGRQAQPGGGRHASHSTTGKIEFVTHLHLDVEVYTSKPLCNSKKAPIFFHILDT